MMGLPAYNLLFVLLQLHFGIRLDKHLDEDDAVFSASADALHEARIANPFLVLHIAKLCSVDACGADRGGREREALSHDGDGQTSPEMVEAIDREWAMQSSFLRFSRPGAIYDEP